MQQPPVVTPQDMIRAIQDALAQINSTLQQLSATLTPAPATPPGDGQLATVQSDIGLRGRVQPSINASIKETIPNGTALNVTNAGSADGYDWCKVVDGQYAGLFVARTYLAFAEAAAVG